MKDPLPDNDNTFWKVGEYEAENEVHTPRQRSCLKHEFKQIGMNAECGCGVGYPLSPGSEVKSGHIYISGTLVV